ncbi:MAG: aldehyde ferredoxin oxidoreductase family protein [Candidatus Heimdallarchaeota archaeon]|nr:aldehyde ferredoxin oxidoreductase family protein [Candidatus Heimdallarchaeota archaeon]MCK4771033.1 aldehyde ferredoxin oxidoreductase family protein [Candidatus Heimdallarchaeota archaeon]
MNNKLLRINLTNETFKVEEIPESVVYDYMGGTGYITYYLYKELSPKIDPLSEENKIIIAPGPLQGTRVPISGRYAMGTKGPLTSLYLDSNAGGFFGPEVRFAGYDLIIIEGKSAKPVYISIKNSAIEIKDAQDLWGRFVYETEVLIKELEREPKMRILSIGPAGENLVKFACTTSDNFRNAGRGGLGAVFGFKNLKAVAVKGSTRPTNGNPEKIDSIRKDIIQRAKNAKEDGHLLHQHGTSFLVKVASDLDHYPTRNWQEGEFEDVEKLSHETFAKKYKRFRRPCYQCPIGCSETLDASIFDWVDKDRKEIAKPEYETLAMLGGNCGISDDEAVIHANYLCNQLGLDTISTGSALAMTMEAKEKGLVEGPEFDDVEFGNIDKFLELIDMIAYRKGIGDILAEGVAQAAEYWGIEDLAIHVKKLPFAAWDPRAKLGLGLSYAVAAVGASHLRGWPSTSEIPSKSAVDVIDSLIEQQDLKTIKDCLTICHFTHSIKPALTFEDCVNITSAMWDREVTEEELINLARRVWIMKRMFNIREFGDKKPIDFDYLPKRFMKEPLPTGRAEGKTAFVDEEDFIKSRNTLYEKRGLDEFGVPTKEEKEKLNLL